MRYVYVVYLYMYVQNPYITQYIETAKDESFLYIVMEAVLGGPLHRHIQLHGRLAIPRVQIYLAQLISCCEHMAKQGCIHRGMVWYATECISLCFLVFFFYFFSLPLINFIFYT